MNSKNNRLNSASNWKRLLPCSLLGVILWAAPDAEANWRVSPELGVGIEYDDNVSLNDVSGLSDSDTEYGIIARATFQYDAELTDLTITPELRSRKFKDRSDLDSNDQFLRFRLRHDRQKSNFSFRGKLSSESVRTAERSQVDFEIEDPEEISADDTGRVFGAGKRDRVKLNPEFAYDLSRRTSMRVVGEYRDTKYDDEVALFLNDYSEYSIGAMLDYMWSERDSFSLGAYSGNFEVDGSDFESQSNTFEIGYYRELSERTQFRMLLGSDSSEDENGEDQSNAVGELSIIHRYEMTRVIASYQRTTDGNGIGERSIRDSVSLNISRDISQRLTLSAGVRAYSTEALDNSDPDSVDDDYLQIRALARWNVSRTLSLDLDYRYTDVNRKIVGIGDVGGDSNQIGLWLYWHPNPLTR